MAQRQRLVPSSVHQLLGTSNVPDTANYIQLPFTLNNCQCQKTHTFPLDTQPAFPESHTTVEQFS